MLLELLPSKLVFPPQARVGSAHCRRQAPGLGTTDTKLLLLVVLWPAAAVVWANARTQNLSP